MDYNVEEDHRRPRRSLQLDQLERPTHSPIMESSLYSPYAQISRRRRSLDATMITSQHHQHPHRSPHQQLHHQQQQELLGRPIYQLCRESSVNAQPDAAEVSQHSSESGDEVCSGAVSGACSGQPRAATNGNMTPSATAAPHRLSGQVGPRTVNNPFAPPPSNVAAHPAAHPAAPAAHASHGFGVFTNRILESSQKYNSAERAAENMNVDEQAANFGAAAANLRGSATPGIFGAAAPAAAPVRAPVAANRRLRSSSATIPAGIAGEAQMAAPGEWVDWSNVDCAFQPDGLMQARAAMIEQCRQNSRRAALGTSVPMMAD